MTIIFNSVKEWRNFRKQTLFINKSVGFVPTMGNLHQGHQSLMQRSVSENDITVLSIFTNPTQFDNPDDLRNYPKTFDADIEMAKKMKVDFVFSPHYQDIYPDNYHYQLMETQLSQQLCGKHRPGHFSGVLTIVMKLLLLIKANRVYFGEKDFQQLELIRGMISAFFIDTQLIACPTIRNNHGLALSSRNNLLTSEQQQLAAEFFKLLNSNHDVNQIIGQLTKLGFVVEYIEEYIGRRFGAVRLGTVRLIDNVELTTCS